MHFFYTLCLQVRMAIISVLILHEIRKCFDCIGTRALVPVPCDLELRIDKYMLLNHSASKVKNNLKGIILIKKSWIVALTTVRLSTAPHL